MARRITKYDWLDNIIKEQASNRRVLGKDAERLQELAEQHDWDRPKRKKKRRRRK